MAFDARWWNLSAGALVAAGCGPSIVLQDADTDASDDAGTDDDGNDDAVPPGDDGQPPMPECTQDSDCPSSEYYCAADGTCRLGGYDDGYYDDGYYDDDGYYCDFDCNECDSDEDCGAGELCREYEYTECVALEEIPECPTGEAPTLGELPIALEGASDVVSLSFLDANGDAARDLLVARTDGAVLLLGPGDGTPIAVPALDGSVVLDAASADFDGDGDLDLAVAAAQDGVIVLLSDGAGGYVASETGHFDAPDIASIVAVDFDSDGSTDVAFGGAQSMTVLGGDGAGGLAELMLLHDGQADDVAAVATEFTGPGLLGSTSSGVLLWRGGLNPNDVFDETLLPSPPSSPWLVTTPGALNDWVLGFAGVNNWTLVGSASNDERAMLRPVDQATTGDFDGDGSDDVVLRSGALAVFVRGIEGAPDCERVYGFSEAVDHIAVGDLDGDGRADLARASGPTVTLYRSQ